MKTLSLKVPDPLDRQLERMARRQGATKSHVIRSALTMYVRREWRPAKGSCLDLASDLAGCAKGPRDLSANTRRLKGFGQ